ncbi:HAMP domain-containing sensor histidine kinase [Paracoccus sp. 1_MG-2023]|uniref:sensor histidine kinase n=1 Tax=unclassified Paracoccus (in: a-proteobacteria) TaxID=2688777 RepID=UPI001C08F0DB|nr:MULTISPECIES: HAMP domain-containing sensor histidine kinase [unclassified Paracoccus (in: a-proteobacteria)]MBU2958331.1 HAMP domain-containing histidine kinase [Paracoccus sp. C2R09]MDO6668458.1 HAMP domain-containing sensor histidine kinase [Paracoccus sp. 1_MG-2023]
MLRSIRGQLLVLAAVWLGAALLAAFLFISGLLEGFVTDRFDAEAQAAADSLIGRLEVLSDGRIELEGIPMAANYDLPFSGWYWQVAADGVPVARSLSLLDARLDGPGGNLTGASGLDADGAGLRILRQEITLPDSDALIAVTVTAPHAAIDQSLQQITRPLAMALLLLWVVLAAATVIQVTAGLGSLGRLRRDLALVRAGKAERLPRPSVTELRPLVDEINGALDQNATLLTRSRQHLGNLAHSLKTPLAALSNELPQDHDGQALIARMDRLIGWHLRRARSAGPRVLGQHTPVASVVEDILLVLRWPMAEKGMGAETVTAPDAQFLGERQDLEEMIGNLCENAVKWGRNRLRVTVEEPAGHLILKVEDDGPGMDPDKIPQALRRGGRLDEQGPPGAGLGLAIVADLAALHGGHLRLERSDLGGLAAIVDLPA